ncbi:MAG: DUF2088 domain-containing protein [Deltaproteobacteria bacterium]|nr:DUF2088 domain-containing protein [Deltaproteobacteria bacterium]
MLIPANSHFPKVALVEQQIPAPRVADVSAVISSEFQRQRVAERIKAGMRIAVAAGSRGINGIPGILSTVVGELKRLGAEPFIVPAMGSHGGATAEGQVSVLHSLGITEQAVGCPIHSSMDTVQIGETPDHIPVLIDKVASQADGIVVVARIKGHTEYSGPVESGLMKMLTIGLGKHQGALTAHKNAVQFTYRVAIVSVAREIIRRSKLILGVGLVENACDETAEIAVVWPEDFEETERALLKRAKALMPRIPFSRLDVLVVDEIGKEISGSGMDTNVIGRRMVFGEPEPIRPVITRIVVRDLSKNTYGSGAGIGLADFTTRRLVDRLERRPTYLNCLTAMTPEKARIPMTAESDREAIEWALLTAGNIPPPQARLMRIKNTMHLEKFYVSEALRPEIEADGRLRVASAWQRLAFDEKGALQPEQFEYSPA